MQVHTEIFVEDDEGKYRLYSTGEFMKFDSWEGWYFRDPKLGEELDFLNVASKLLQKHLDANS